VQSAKNEVPNKLAVFSFGITKIKRDVKLLMTDFLHIIPNLIQGELRRV